MWFKLNESDYIRIIYTPVLIFLYKRILKNILKKYSKKIF